MNYVDPANLVYSYTEDPNFDDIYYAGEVKSISLVELKKQFPGLSDEELKEIENFLVMPIILETFMRNKILIIKFKCCILNTKLILTKFLK